MGFAGYVAVCVQLYCRGKLSLFHTTFFGLYGHLQVCRMLLLSCSWKNVLYVARGYAFVRFHLWGGLNMRYYLFIIYYLCYFECYGTYVFYLHVFSCSILSFYFPVSCGIINNTSYLTHPTDGRVQKRNHVQDTEKTSEADSFKSMRVITSYTLEDGHIGRNM
jgi:hypothetical protein